MRSCIRCRKRLEEEEFSVIRQGGPGACCECVMEVIKTKLGKQALRVELSKSNGTGPILFRDVYHLSSPRFVKEPPELSCWNILRLCRHALALMVDWRAASFLGLVLVTSCCVIWMY